MIVVGLTGGIGSGKSTVAALLAERGAVVIDADEVARAVVEPGRRAYTKVVERFGSEVVASDGSLDRSAIASIVFGNPEALAELNAIIHPEVRAEIASRLASLPDGDRVVVLDIPLLVEEGGRDRYGLAGVIVVDAPLDLVLERLVTRRRMDRSDAEARIVNQVSRPERIAQADFLIMNTGTLDQLEGSAARAWAWIQGLRARAVGSGGHPAG
jgi:dephospho-CoA kinase